MGSGGRTGARRVEGDEGEGQEVLRGQGRKERTLEKRC